MSYQVKDSGQRQEFATGARRDTRTGKGRFDLISPRFLKRIAVVLERGAEKYGENNWEKGIPLSRSLDSCLRHLNQVKLGEKDEDHLAHAAVNVMFIMHMAELINEGERPASLDDIGYCEPRVKYPTTWPLPPDQLETVSERMARLQASESQDVRGGASEREKRIEEYIKETLRQYEQRLSAYRLYRACEEDEICDWRAAVDAIHRLITRGEVVRDGTGEREADGRYYACFRLPDPPEPAAAEPSPNVLQSLPERERTLQCLEDHIRTLLRGKKMPWREIVKECEYHDYRFGDIWEVCFKRIKLERAGKMKDNQDAWDAIYKLPEEDK